MVFMVEQRQAAQITLKRAFNLPLLTFYGLGTILGAGIYVLVGEVAGAAGMAAPVAFLIAALLATLSALSYAELSARYPLSAGEAVYVWHAFSIPALSRLVGLLLVLIGLVSGATLISGFVGYFQYFVALEAWQIITALVVFLGALAVWGITESAWVAALTTVVEIGGLLLVIWAGGESLWQLPQRLPEMLPAAVGVTPVGLIAGAFLAFYAFIGFEDIVNVAEEVKAPQRTLPRAVGLSLLIATLLYMAVAVVAVLEVPVAELAASRAPLALVYQHASGEAPHFISAISLAAVLNGALIQIIMASRVLYGMARQGWLPAWLAEVNHTTRTPVYTTVLMSGAMLVLALWLPLVTLAQGSSLITLSVFALVNLSLWRIKRREPQPAGVPNIPRWLPLGGFLCSVLFALFQLGQWVRG